jgi:hypothetical protein
VCVLGSGGLAALAVYARRGRWRGAMVVGLVVASATFVATLYVTLGRWAA